MNAFSNLVDNWILWTPNGQIWSPQNRRKVWARGVEVFAKGGIKQNLWAADIRVNGAITRSTIRKIYENSSPALAGKQLIYTPVFTAGAMLSASHKNYFLRYGHQITSRRFTTTDNAAGNALPGFGTGRFIVGTSLPLGQLNPLFQFTILNIWNAEYEIIGARPMPGRNFRAEIRLSIDQNKNR